MKRVRRKIAGLLHQRWSRRARRLCIAASSVLFPSLLLPPPLHPFFHPPSLWEDAPFKKRDCPLEFSLRPFECDAAGHRGQGKANTRVLPPVYLQRERKWGRGRGQQRKERVESARRELLSEQTRHWKVRRVMTGRLSGSATLELSELEDIACYLCEGIERLLNERQRLARLLLLQQVSAFCAVKKWAPQKRWWWWW